MRKKRATFGQFSMQDANHPPKRLRFGVFEADLRLGELTKHGKRLPLQEQPFRLLAMLLARPGQLVTREELRATIWPHTIVDFDHGLNKAVSKVRDALGDSAESPRFIETVARRGYRFLADVALVPDGSQQTATAHPAVGADAGPPVRPEAGTSSPRSPRVPRWMLFGVGVALVLAGAVSWILYTSKTSSSPTIRSLAVLPLKNLSGDASQDYFSDGMTEELITQLGQISALRVISSTSVMLYKGVDKPLADIARELSVQAVVEGSVLRSGDRVRITAQLIRVPADEQMWAQSYEGELRDMLALQSKVAQDIAEQIRATLSRRQQAALRKPRTVSPDAYEDYLKGRYFWNKRTGDGLKKAIDYFSRAVAADPNYAEAYSGLADSYALAGDWLYEVLPPQEAFRQARAAATRALALDDTLGAAHTSLAFALDLYAWDWAAAEKEYKRAIELSPGYATAHHWYAWHLLVMGRDSEGIFEMRRAESLDPLSLIISADLAEALCIAHLYDESVRQSKRTLDLDPNFAVAHYQLGQTLAQKHLYDEAIAEFQRAIELSGHSGAFDSNLAYVYALSGRKVEAEKILEALEAGPGKNPSIDANIALVYVGLGDHDQAMNWLNKAYEARFNPSILLRPAFDPLRSDVRFKDLWRRVGLG
ncbi:MAG TPA: winged helix-turn-helix domain-containing protein [Steroidobacteraceae bacterium]|nr:winged helix-turn-helix domain-containing protein [Steroidobacteraceae bacterium]